MQHSPRWNGSGLDLSCAGTDTQANCAGMSKVILIHTLLGVMKQHMHAVCVCAGMRSTPTIRIRRTALGRHHARLLTTFCHLVMQET